jgi:hypothetical protein
VVATVVLEAWMIGRKLGDGWPKALCISLVANLITASCCPQLFAVGMHQAFVGTIANPDPFLNALFLFTSFGFISALIESVIWRLRRKGPTDWQIVKSSLLAHAAGVPLALVILLIPSRPYVGLEATAGGARRLDLYVALSAYAKAAAGDPKGLPAVTDATDLLKQYGEHSNWASAYVPDFHRFDFGEAKRIPYEWNQRAAGVLIVPDSQPSEDLPMLWLVRAKEGGLYRGYSLDTASGQVSRFTAKTAAELEVDTDAVIRIDKWIRKHPQSDGG